MQRTGTFEEFYRILKHFEIEGVLLEEAEIKEFYDNIPSMNSGLNFNYSHGPIGMDGGGNIAQGKPTTFKPYFITDPTIKIKPKFPDPKPVKIGYMTYDDYHSKIDCENLISPTKEQYCKGKKVIR
jgi:hypothetical protein